MQLIYWVCLVGERQLRFSRQCKSILLWNLNARTCECCSWVSLDVLLLEERSCGSQRADRWRMSTEEEWSDISLRDGGVKCAEKPVVGVGEAFDANERVCLCASGSLVKHNGHVGFLSFSLFCYLFSYYKTYKFTQTVMLSWKLLHTEVPFRINTAVPQDLTPYSLLCGKCWRLCRWFKHKVRQCVHVRNER